MNYNSSQISKLIFSKQIALYSKIDNLITKRFNELDPDMLSVLTRTLMDLEDKIQLYKRDIKTKEMFDSKLNLEEDFSLLKIIKKSKTLSFLDF